MEPSTRAVLPVPVRTIELRLGTDIAELVLIALSALDEVLLDPKRPISEIIETARKFYDIEHLPENLGSSINHAAAEIWDALYDHRMKPWNELMAVDIDTDLISDEEAQSIIRDIEARHGRIIVPEAS